MCLVDERILEYLRDNDVGSPGEIHRVAQMDYADGYFSDRICTLRDKGLVQQVSPRGVYRISEEGSAYLAEDYSTLEKRDMERHSETETETETVTA